MAQLSLNDAYLEFGRYANAGDIKSIPSTLYPLCPNGGYAFNRAQLKSEKSRLCKRSVRGLDKLGQKEASLSLPFDLTGHRILGGQAAKQSNRLTDTQIGRLLDLALGDSGRNAGSAADLISALANSVPANGWVGITNSAGLAVNDAIAFNEGGANARRIVRFADELSGTAVKSSRAFSNAPADGAGLRPMAVWNPLEGSRRVPHGYFRVDYNDEYRVDYEGCMIETMTFTFPDQGGECDVTMAFKASNYEEGRAPSAPDPLEEPQNGAVVDSSDSIFWIGQDEYCVSNVSYTITNTVRPVLCSGNIHGYIITDRKFSLSARMAFGDEDGSVDAAMKALLDGANAHDVLFQMGQGDLNYSGIFATRIKSASATVKPVDDNGLEFVDVAFTGDALLALS